MAMRKATLNEVAIAQYMYRKAGEIDVDANADAVEIPGEGAWIQAWVWVPVQGEKTNERNTSNGQPEN